MSDLLKGELLCLFLLILINGRIFFSRHKNSITIAVLSPVVLLVSIFQILAQGCTFFELIILALSLFTFIANIHAFSRLVSHLYVDRYRLAFYLCSLLLLLCSFAMSAAVIYFREVPVKPEKYGVVETKENLRSINAVLWTYSKKADSEETGFANTFTNTVDNSASDEKNTAAEKPVIIFSADERSDTYRYRPYLVFLARAGYTVYSLDVFDNKISYFSSFLDFPVLKRSALIFFSLFNKEEFNQLKLKMTESIKQEYKVLREIALERHGQDACLFAIGDEMQEDALQYFTQVKNIEGIFQLATIDMYNTKGYGCINQTSPFLAYFLDKSREKSFLVPLYMVKRTEAAISAAEAEKQLSVQNMQN